MARRPRPASRRAPQRIAGQQATKIQGKPSTSKPVKPRPEPIPVESDEDGSEDSEAQVSGSEDVENVSEEDIDEAEGGDADAPRVSQWVDEDELDLEVEEEEDSDGSEDEDEVSIAGPSNLRALQDDLSALPLGALMKAQRALAQARADSDSEADSDDETDDEDSDDESAPEEGPSRIAEHGKPAEKERVRPDKRKHKHAPIEMSNKRRERKKIVIEDKKPVPRDPRFLHITGEFSAERFRSQYGFLSSMHQDEMKTLRENLKRAKRMLASSPRDQLQQRQAEVERLERAVKRAESTVNKDKRDRIEQSAMQKVRQEEREKQKQGKTAWFMKSADKKDVLTRARYDALAEAGGKRAVKKAIEKKQKKVSQKEKKRRPFAPGQIAQRRSAAEGDSSRPHKRQRVG